MKPGKHIDISLWRTIEQDRYDLLLIATIGMASVSAAAIALTILLMIN